MGAQSTVFGKRSFTDDAQKRQPPDELERARANELISGQEPVNVPAILTHKARCGTIGPVKVKERRNRCVQLSVALPKLCVMADFTPQRFTGDFAFLCLFVAKQSHLCGST